MNPFPLRMRIGTNVCSHWFYQHWTGGTMYCDGEVLNPSLTLGIGGQNESIRSQRTGGDCGKEHFCKSSIVSAEAGRQGL